MAYIQANVPIFRSTIKAKQSRRIPVCIIYYSKSVQLYHA